MRWCRWPSRCRRWRSPSCRATSTRKATIPEARGRHSTPSRCWPPRCRAMTSDWSARPACPPWPTRVARWCGPRTSWAWRWCRWSARSRCCWRSPPAGSMGRTSRLWAISRPHRPSAHCARRRGTRRTHPRARITRAQDRPDPAVHRNALPQCSAAAGAAGHAAAPHPVGGVQRAHPAACQRALPHGAAVAATAARAGQPHARGICVRAVRTAA
jgi:hypothetical protein